MSDPGLLITPADLRKYDRSMDTRGLTNETLVYYITNVSVDTVSFAFDGSSMTLMPGMTISILSTPDQLAHMLDLQALIVAGSVTISSNVPVAPAPGTIVASGQINADGTIAPGARGILSVTLGGAYFIITVDLTTPPGLDGGYAPVVVPQGVTSGLLSAFVYFGATLSNATPGRVNVTFTKADGSFLPIPFFFALIRAK